MAFDGKTLKRDGSGITPVPQHFNPIADDYEPIYGRNNAGRVEIYGPDGQPISTTDNKLAVRASEIETLLESLDDKDFATQTTLAAILAKIIAAPATEAKQDTLIGHVDGVESALASILAKLIAAPATEAKQTALAELIGEVQASPTENTLLARIKALETKIDAIIAGTTPATVQLSGSNLQENPYHSVDGMFPVSEVENFWIRMGRYGIQEMGNVEDQAITSAAYAGPVLLKPGKDRRLYVSRVIISTTVDAYVRVYINNVENMRGTLEAMATKFYENAYLAAGKPLVLNYVGDVWMEDDAYLSVQAKAASISGILVCSAHGWEVTQNA